MILENKADEGTMRGSCITLNEEKENKWQQHQNRYGRAGGSILTLSFNPLYELPSTRQAAL
jgi:hypothetical protein